MMKGKLRSISEVRPVFAGRASGRHAPAQSRVCLRGRATRPPSAGGVQEESSRAGVEATSPRHALQDTAKSGLRPRQSVHPSRPPSHHKRGYIVNERIIHASPRKSEKNYCSLQLEGYGRRNRLFGEERSLHGLRDREAGSDTQVTLPIPCWAPGPLRLSREL